MGLFRKFGRLLGAGARIGLGFATGGPTGAAAAGIREISRGRARRSRRRSRRRADPRLGPMFQPVPAPLVDTRRRTRTGQLIDVLGGGGRFGGGGAGATFGPPARRLPAAGGGVTFRGVDVSAGAIAVVPVTRTVIMPRPGFVTVTLPVQMFGFAAGSKIQMVKELAMKFGLHKRRRKPLLSAGDLDALRRAKRTEGKLIRLTNQHTDFRCVSKASRARASARVSSKKR